MARSPFGLRWFVWLVIGFIGGLLAVGGFQLTTPTPQERDWARRIDWAKRHERWSHRFHALSDVLSRECNSAAPEELTEMLLEWNDALENDGPPGPPP